MPKEAAERARSSRPATAAIAVTSAAGRRGAPREARHAAVYGSGQEVTEQPGAKPE